MRSPPCRLANTTSQCACACCSVCAAGSHHDSSSSLVHARTQHPPAGSRTPRRAVEVRQWLRRRRRVAQGEAPCGGGGGAAVRPWCAGAAEVWGAAVLWRSGGVEAAPVSWRRRAPRRAAGTGSPRVPRAAAASPRAAAARPSEPCGDGPPRHWREERGTLCPTAATQLCGCPAGQARVRPSAGQAKRGSGQARAGLPCAAHDTLRRR